MSITGSSSIRRLEECPVVMGLHELVPVGGRATSGRHRRRFEWFVEVCENLPDRPRLCDERDQLADIPDCQRRDGPPELVVGCKHPVVSMPVLPRRRDEIGEPVQELKRNSNGVSSTTPLAPGRVDFRPRPGPTQLAALCLGST